MPKDEGRKHAIEERLNKGRAKKVLAVSVVEVDPQRLFQGGS
jgi:hypothetical protein